MASPTGANTAPFSAAEMTAKFVDCGRRAARPLPEAALERIAGQILALEDLEDVRPLLQAL